MAAVSAWAKPGAWATAVEEEEKEKGYDSTDSSQNASEFPSLAAAVATKTSKKQKAQPVSLAKFNTGQDVSYGSGNRSVSRGLSSDESLQLPTGPRERTAEELERASSRGFGYSSYGNRGGPRDEANSRWGSGSGSSRVSDEQKNGFGGGGSNRDLGPSRADEVDDWGAGKRSMAAPERRRESGFFDSQSRADESESWVSNKTAPSLSNGRRINGSGFDGPRERKGGFDAYGKGESNGRADSDTWGKKREETSGGGRPRIVLQPRTLPLVNESNGESPVKSKGENPFGAARPREEVLAEKGQDWKKIDEKLELTKIREAPQEGKTIGRKGSRSEDGFALEGRTERSWRKAENETMSASARSKS